MTVLYCFFTHIQDPLYAGAILIIRNPYDAFIAEWTRRSSGHTGTARVGRFGMYTCTCTLVISIHFIIIIIIIICLPHSHVFVHIIVCVCVCVPVVCVYVCVSTCVCVFKR